MNDVFAAGSKQRSAFVLPHPGRVSRTMITEVRREKECKGDTRKSLRQAQNLTCCTTVSRSGSTRTSFSIR